jgi:phosphatidylglycerophosphate synthase
MSGAVCPTQAREPSRSDVRGSEPLSAANIDVVTERPHVKFLGLDVAERNKRVFYRALQRRPEFSAGSPCRAPGGTGERAELSIPAGAAITPTLVDALPNESGTCRLAWAPGRPPLVWRLGEDRAGTARTVSLQEGAVLDVSTGTARRRSAWRLLCASGKPTDGWQARLLHRRISRLFSYVFLQLGLSANLATFFAFAVGVLGAWFLAQTTHATLVAGTALFWFASIADGIDGEMARLTVSDSEWGERLDTAVDLLTYVFALVGVFAGWWRQGMGEVGRALAVGVPLGLAATVLWTTHVVGRARGVRCSSELKLAELGLNNAAAAARAPALRVASLVFVLFRRESMSLVFFFVSLITDRRAAGPVLAGVGCAFVVATFVLYRREIDAGIRRLAIYN